MTDTDEYIYEVAYALADKQVILVVNSQTEMTVMEVVDASGILEKFPDLDRENLKLGVFGKVTKPDVVLRHGDRVEIYRPLLADPKEVRKRRAAEGKAMKKGAGTA